MKENYEAMKMEVIAFDKDVWTDDTGEVVLVSRPGATDEEVILAK